MEKIEMMKVIAVDKNGFTLEDGTYCEHPALTVPHNTKIQNLIDSV